MSLLGLVQSLFRKKPAENEGPYSIVMLFRSPFLLSKEVLNAAASKAYGVPFDGSHEMYFTVQNLPVTMMKAGPALINVMQEAQPYLGEPAEVAQGFRDQRLRAGWTEHQTWAAFDLMNEDLPKKRAYQVLAPLVVELLDVRCSGIYLPRDNQFTIQSDGSAAAHLRSLAR